MYKVFFTHVSQLTLTSILEESQDYSQFIDEETEAQRHAPGNGPSDHCQIYPTCWLTKNLLNDQLLIVSKQWKEG